MFRPLSSPAMADDPDNNPEASDPSPAPGREKPASRRKPLTPELRRFQGPGRSWHEREAAKQEAIPPDDEAVRQMPAAPEAPTLEPWPGMTPPLREAAPNKPDR